MKVYATALPAVAHPLSHSHLLVLLVLACSVLCGSVE
jgi:hypothetical protein